MEAGANAPEAAAVDLAEWLVRRGVPFRQAHARVGGLVRRSLAGEGGLAALVAAEEDLGAEAAALFEPGAAVLRRTTPGGAGPAPVAEQMERVRAMLEADRDRL